MKEIFDITDKIVSEAIGVDLKVIEEYLELKRKHQNNEEPQQDKDKFENKEDIPQTNPEVQNEELVNKVENSAKSKTNKKPLF